LGNLPRQPRCTDCPMRGLCVAERQGQTELDPVKSRKLKRSSQRLWLLWAERADGSVWLERRPESGIWGGCIACQCTSRRRRCCRACPNACAPLCRGSRLLIKRLIAAGARLLQHQTLGLVPAL
jgi:A/G-specific adenine glycosylase